MRIDDGTGWLKGLALALLACAATARAEVDPAADASRCTAIGDDAARLACYDRALRRAPSDAVASPSPPVPSPAPGARTRVYDRDTAAAPAAHPSLLDSRWELDEASKQGEFHIRAYKPVYLLPFFFTSRTNRTPSSPAEGRTVSESRELQKSEAVYQLSLKTKLWENVFGDNGDLWTGYTQTSHWQVYNGKISRPFSETNYEPELTLAFRTDYDVLGWNGRLLGFTINHQSNGQSQPLSRSWNRAMLNVGFEREGWSVMLRPWWRIHDDNDDNPDISDYVGRGDVQIVRVWRGHEFALMLRHSLRGGDRSRGAAQFDWAFPLVGELRGHLQLFRGYGQSLIDYNHDAWYAGIGVSLLEWY
jgi:phospholipase A1